MLHRQRPFEEADSREARRIKPLYEKLDRLAGCKASRASLLASRIGRELSMREPAPSDPAKTLMRSPRASCRRGACTASPTSASPQFRYSDRPRGGACAG